MNAVTLDSLEAQPGLRDDLPAPTMADNEVLVRVHSSSVNPVDNAIAAGMLSGMAEHVGAAGGVGSLAVQLAARAGATVIAPALPVDDAYLRDLGVTDVLPRDEDLVAHVRERYPDGVDALLDLVSYTAGSYDATLKTDARIASTAGAAGEGAGRTNVVAVPSVANLQRLGALLADGALRVPVQATYTLAQAPEALAARAATHSQGKIAIQIG